MNTIRLWLIRLLAGGVPVVLNARIAAADAVPKGTVMTIGGDDRWLIEDSTFQECGVVGVCGPLPTFRGRGRLDVVAPSMKFPWDPAVCEMNPVAEEQVTAFREFEPRRTEIPLPAGSPWIKQTLTAQAPAKNEGVSDIVPAGDKKALLRKLQELSAQRAAARRLSEVTLLSVDQAETLLVLAGGDTELAKAAAHVAIANQSFLMAKEALLSGWLRSETGGQH